MEKKTSRTREPRGLSFSDDPMFKRVMEREDICRGVIERVLGIPVGKVEYHNTEQEVRTLPGGKTIRLDSYLVESGGKLFDVEMQVSPGPAFPRRLRAYQSILDAGTLKRGEDYDRLKESYLVFICLEDPFGAGLPVYTVERTCLESPQTKIDCKAHWVVLNASAYESVHDNEGLRSLLQYVATGKVAAGDPLLVAIDGEVERNNRDKAVVGMMIDTMAMLEQEARVRGRAEGREEGLAEGRQEGLSEGIGRYESLVKALLDAGRMDDLRQATSDVAFRDALFVEFGIA